MRSCTREKQVEACPLCSVYLLRTQGLEEGHAGNTPVWGAALFVGALVAVIIGFRGNGRSDWLFAAIIGGLVFFSCGLIAQGIITLPKKGEYHQIAF